MPLDITTIHTMEDAWTSYRDHVLVKIPLSEKEIAHLKLAFMAGATTCLAKILDLQSKGESLSVLHRGLHAFRDLLTHSVQP